MTAVLWKLVAGLQCGVLYSDHSPQASRLHRQLSTSMPLAYPPPPLQPSTCPLFLLFSSPGAVRQPVFALPPGPSYRVLLVTWQPPSSYDEQAISSYFHRTTFLWISEFGEERENYRSFKWAEEVPRLVNETEAANLFQFKKLRKLPNYKGKKFTIATNNHSIYSQLSQQDKHGNFKMEGGIELKALFEMCYALGLRPVITEVASWDNHNVNGSLKTAGLQSGVKNWRVDAAVGSIWFTPPLVGQVEMLPPWDQRCYRYLVPRPSKIVFDWTILLDVFDVWVWVLIICLTVMVAVLLVLSTKLSPKTKLQKGSESLWHALFTVSTVFLQVPLLRREWTGPQVPILYSWVWTVLVLTAAYGGSLSAYLVKPEFEEKPNTIAEFLKRGYTHGSPMPIEEMTVTFKGDQSDHWKEWMWGRFKIENSPQDRIDRMKTRKYVVSGESIDRIYYFFEAPILPDDVIELYEAADNCYQSFFTGPIFPPGSPYSGALHKVASRMRSGGLLNSRISTTLMNERVLREFVLPEVFTRTEEGQKSFSPLSFGSLSAIFGVLGVGLFLASCCFFAELFLGQPR